MPNRAGTAEVLRTVRDIAERGAREPTVQRVSSSLWNAACAGGGEGAVGAFVDLALAYVQREIRFQLAIPTFGRELFREAGFSLRTGAGKCADKAPLLGALLLARGVQVRFAAVPAQDGGVEHVYLEAELPGGWSVLEPTAVRALVGESAHEVPVEGDGRIRV